MSLENILKYCLHPAKWNPHLWMIPLAAIILAFGAPEIYRTLSAPPDYAEVFLKSGEKVEGEIVGPNDVRAGYLDIQMFPGKKIRIPLGSIDKVNIKLGYK
ncbi:MAG: hypothetical protein V2A69_16050 [Pseudomonadota bacterium]